MLFRSWYKLRTQKKKDCLYQCEICRGMKKIGGYVDQVHHIKKIRGYWEDRLSYENLLGVCKAHHDTIHTHNLQTKKEIENHFNIKLDENVL